MSDTDLEQNEGEQMIIFIFGETMPFNIIFVKSFELKPQKEKEKQLSLMIHLQ